MVSETFSQETYKYSREEIEDLVKKEQEHLDLLKEPLLSDVVFDEIKGDFDKLLVSAKDGSLDVVKRYYEIQLPWNYKRMLLDMQWTKQEIDDAKPRKRIYEKILRDNNVLPPDDDIEELLATKNIIRPLSEKEYQAYRNNFNNLARSAIIGNLTYGQIFDAKINEKEKAEVGIMLGVYEEKATIEALCDIYEQIIRKNKLIPPHYWGDDIKKKGE